jgi:hypothetical protein
MSPLTKGYHMTTRIRSVVEIDETESFHNAALGYTGGTPDAVETRPETINVTVNHANRITEDIETPNFHQLMKEGKIINNPYNSLYRQTARAGVSSRCKEKYVQAPGRWADYYGKRDVIPSINQANLLYLNGAFKYQTDIDYLIDKTLLSSAASVNAQSMDALVTIAEMKRTVGFLTGSFSAGLKQLVSTKKRFLAVCRKRGRAVGSIQDMIRNNHDLWANLWLGTRYGLMPLLFDIEKGIDAVNSLGKPLRKRYSSTLLGEKTDTWSLDGLSINRALEKYHLATISLDFTETSRWEVSSGVLAEWTIRDINPAHAFGLHAVPMAVWELVPYSFVVDWFIGIGRFIEAWQPTPDVIAQARWTVIRRTSRVRAVYQPGSLVVYDDAEFNIKRVDYASYQFYEKYTERIADPSVPILPQVSSILDLGVSKIGDLIALANQLLK